MRFPKGMIRRILVSKGSGYRIRVYLCKLCSMVYPTAKLVYEYPGGYRKKLCPKCHNDVVRIHTRRRARRNVKV